jgi:hypothetical protein
LIQADEPEQLHPALVVERARPAQGPDSSWNAFDVTISDEEVACRGFSVMVAVSQHNLILAVGRVIGRAKAAEKQDSVAKRWSTDG